MPLLTVGFDSPIASITDVAPAILERMMTFEQAPGAPGSVGAPPSTTSPDSAAERG